MSDINNSSGAMITLVLGVGIAVLLMIFVGALGGQVYQTVESDIDAIANSKVANESFTAINNTVVSLGHDYIQSGSLTILNSTTGNVVIGLGNYTIDYTQGTIKLISGTQFNNTPARASYTYGVAEVRENIKGAIVSSFDSLEKTGSYMPLLVLATVIGVVLFIVLGFTNFGRGSGNVL